MMLEHPEDFRNITLQDIVRSSEYIEQHNLYGRIEKGEKLFLGLTEGNFADYRFATAFPFAICDNPNGEAISSVWANKARNYACKCNLGLNHFDAKLTQNRHKW